MIEGANNQGGRTRWQQMYQDYIPQFSSDYFPKYSLERKAMKRIRKIKVGRHLNTGTTATSMIDTDAQKTLHHKMARRPKQLIHHQEWVGS